MEITLYERPVRYYRGERLGCQIAFAFIEPTTKTSSSTPRINGPLDVFGFMVLVLYLLESGESKR